MCFFTCGVDEQVHRMVGVVIVVIIFLTNFKLLSRKHPTKKFMRQKF